MDTIQYQNAFLNAQKQSVSGLCGRIIRGVKDNDFLTLTDDPNRKLVMLMGPDGLESILGKNGYESLVAIGYESDYIRHKIEVENNKFKLVVFSSGKTANIATWDNVIDIVSSVYPSVAAKLYSQKDALKQISFSEIEKTAGFKFNEVDKNGTSDNRFMNLERFEQSNGNIIDVRAFLYFSVHLKELFSGDGFTYTFDGKKGLMEYIVPNMLISDLDDSKLISLDIQIPKQNKVNQMSNKELQIPSIYDESTVEQIRSVAYNTIASVARQWAVDNAIKPAASDKVKVAVLGIDMQNTFCTPGGELFVQGAVEDTKRFVEFIYRNMNYISKLAMTLDTHTAEQIFHEEFFVNDAGEHPAPMTMISIQDIENGIWKISPSVAANIANGNYIAVQNHVLHYVKELKAKGRYDLIIWPYHAILGGVGHALVPVIEEACFFFDRARNSQTKFEVKGGNPLTENYSVFGAEVLTTTGGKPIAQKNTSFIKLLLDFDYVIIGGQAKSHCVAWTIEDLLNEIQARDPKLAKKVYLLEDCTSPVVVPGIVDYTQDANDAFAKFANAGMNIVKSTDSIESWPGINL